MGHKVVLGSVMPLMMHTWFLADTQVLLVIH